MKVFAFYLPQFHTIPENDNWWGEGFTEWVNVKKSKPLFKGHVQPIHPLNDNYYNLLDENTVLWQTDLLHKYMIDGFIYYHYYFEGKLLLEKPAENLLKNKKINQPFFFCWANHSWKRSWEGKSTTLIEQTYGGEASWEKHFQYLLPFFKDERYEKKDNKPLFMIFLPFFKEKEPMMKYFDKRCKEEGFSGISVIDSIQNIYSKAFKEYMLHENIHTDYIFLREPGVGQTIYKKKYFILKYIRKIKSMFSKKFHIGKYVLTYNGDKILKESLRYNINKSYCSKLIRGLCFEWDNTSRHGYRGYIIKPISKKMFTEFMDNCSNEDFIFINAWNEWCEGMILEPTEENGYKYLEWIKEYRKSKKI